MLLQEKMQQENFSPNEQVVVNFILEKQEQIDSYSTRMIAEETYTSPSVLIRIAKKLEYNGWKELKAEFLKEINYLQENFENLDANKPFNAEDSLIGIAHKVAQIKTESLKDTLSLFESNDLQQAIQLIDASRSIKVFGVSNILFLGEEFVHKMRHIHKHAEIYSTHNTMFQEAAMSASADCAICISYSGETGELLKTVEILQKNNVPIIAITSVGDNRLSNLADVTLRVTTREKAYSKIAGFTSLESISLILDVLYSGYFALKYDENFEYKVNIAEMTEVRDIDNQIISD